MKKNKILNLITTILFYFFIIYFFIGFNFQDTQTGGWTRQFFPASIGSAPINGIDFKDSLIGYAITNLSTTSTDTNYVLKTTNGGYNWLIIMTLIELRVFDIKSLNKDTVFIGTDFNIFRTYNGGQNWTSISNSMAYGIFVLNTDTIWYTNPGFGGGLFRTTNGGLSWTTQTPSSATGYIQDIYMYNKNIGFLGTDASELFKTTNCGVNWIKIPGALNFSDMHFKDSLTGFLASSGVYKTTNGGFNWQIANLPNVIGGTYTSKIISKFSFNNDSIYAVGINCNVWYGGTNYKAVIFKTTNSGTNWGYQTPDTSYNLVNFSFVKFINGKCGWCYRSNQGIHTTIGGDTTFLAGISKTNDQVADKFKLFQNYPNPFNATSNIKYKIEKTSNIKLIIFDITGKEIATLVDKKQNPGKYQVIFDGNNFSSGVYFYTLFENELRVDTKKMILIK